MTSDSGIYVVIGAIQYARIYEIVNGKMIERLIALWEVSE